MISNCLLGKFYLVAIATRINTKLNKCVKAIPLESGEWIASIKFGKLIFLIRCQGFSVPIRIHNGIKQDLLPWIFPLQTMNCVSKFGSWGLKIPDYYRSYAVE